MSVRLMSSFMSIGEGGDKRGLGTGHPVPQKRQDIRRHPLDRGVDILEG
jgi:hypothetical protein